MGYLSNLSGEFTISPPLSHDELRRQEDFGRENGVFIDSRMAIPEGPGATDPRWSAEKVSTVGGEVKAYEIQKDLQAIVEAFPGHDFDGAIVRRGEDGDHDRFIVRGGRVMRQVPVVAWVDGEEQA